MFKSTVFLAISAVLFSLPAFAMPKVGDFAVYDITLTSSSGSGTGTNSQEIVQFDAAKNQYLVHSTQQFSGQPPASSDDWLAPDNLMDDATADKMLGNCAGFGGHLEQVQVPAGSFSTCALPVDDQDTGTKGTVWVAKVPFGQVKFETTDKDGLKMSSALRSFH